MKTITLILTLLLVLILLDKTIPKLIESAKMRSQSDRMKYGYITKQDIQRLDLREYEIWSFGFLQSMDYEVLKIIPGGIFEGHSFICRKTTDKYFVEFRKSGPCSKDNVDVDKKDIQQIIGAMVGERLDSGIVITTEKFTQSALDYIKNLPSEYEFDLIDGDQLIKKCWEIRDKEIDMYVKQKSKVNET